LTKAQKEILAKVGKIFFLILFIVANFSFFFLIKGEFNSWHDGNSEYFAHKIYTEPLDSPKIFALGNGEDNLIATISKFEYPPRSREVILFSPLQKTDKQFSFLLHLKVPQNYAYFSPLDVDGDGRVEVPFLWLANRKFHLELKDLAGKTVLANQLEDLSLPIPSDTINFRPILIRDIDADGRLEALWSISGEFMGLPRGIAVHDVQTGKKEWDFLFGAILFQEKVLDIDRDGREEIVFSAWAPHNGYSYNGMNDDTSYVGLLGCDGKLRWIREAGGYFSDIRFDVADLDGDHTPEIVTARACHREVGPDPGEIKILNAADGSSLRQISRPEVSFSQPWVIDLDPTPGPEIVVGDASGNLELLTGALVSLRRISLGEQVRVLDVGSLGRNRNYIAVRIGASRFSLLDGGLNLLFTHTNGDKANERIELLSLRRKGQSHLFLNAERPFMIAENKARGEALALLGQGRFSWILLTGLAFDLLVFCLAWGLVRRNRAKVPPWSEPDPGWLTVTQEMVHRMKTPMTNILWEAEQLKVELERVSGAEGVADSLKRVPDSLINELKELKLMNRYLMKFLQIQAPKLKRIDLNALLKEEADKYSRHLRDRIDIRLKLDFDLPPIAVDEEQIGEVFVNIIENAIDAMPDGGTLEIDSLRAQNGSRGHGITFTDTGRGMTQEQVAMVFNPEYTTKTEGFGIGLPLCQRIIAAHGGTISVSSRVGVGTKIALFIPWEHSLHGTNE